MAQHSAAWVAVLAEGFGRLEHLQAWAVLADFSALASVCLVHLAGVASVTPASSSRRPFVPPLASVALFVEIAAVSYRWVNVEHRSARTAEHSPDSVVPSEEHSAEVARLTVQPEAQRLYLGLAYWHSAVVCERRCLVRLSGLATHSEGPHSCHWGTYLPVAEVARSVDSTSVGAAVVFAEFVLVVS